MEVLHVSHIYQRPDLSPPPSPWITLALAGAVWGAVIALVLITI